VDSNPRSHGRRRLSGTYPKPSMCSSMGLVYGVSNLGKFIGPAGLVLIAGQSNLVSP